MTPRMNENLVKLLFFIVICIVLLFQSMMTNG